MSQRASGANVSHATCLGKLALGCDYLGSSECCCKTSQRKKNLNEK